MNHIPVLLNEVLETLGPSPRGDAKTSLAGKTIVDCTFGGGGYSRAFLDNGANVIALDRDPTVAPTASVVTAEYGEKFQFINAPFSDIKILGRAVDAVVFDLGISSMQIDTAERGFSWRFDAPLDMRMNANNGATADDLIRDLSAAELARILRDYGDVRKSAPIARAIKTAMPQTTFRLRDLIHNPKDIAPVFQALRIKVNDEMNEIETALAAVPSLLPSGGVCICITFHSLEDRLVKNTFREWTTVPGDPRLPATGSALFKLLKTMTPAKAELSTNPRARSAHLRAVIKM